MTFNASDLHKIVSPYEVLIKKHWYTGPQKKNSLSAECAAARYIFISLLLINYEAGIIDYP